MQGLEEWKDITGYEGLYQVSNFGRIKSLTKTINSSFNKKRTVPEKVIKPTVGHNGYLYITLSKGNKRKKVYVHRVVGDAFLDNPHNKPCINHKDYDRKNNSTDNLEWVTVKENINYSSNNMSKAHIGKSSTPNKIGEMYIYKTTYGTYIFQIQRLSIYSPHKTLDEALEARKAVVGW